jgi:hypothetical protein
MADIVNIEVTAGELAALQELRRTHSIPDAVGRPMPYDESERKWGQAPPPNPVSVQRLPTPQAWVEKQIQNLSAVGETNYRVGITTPKKSPIGAAIAAQGSYENAMRNPEVLKRREAGLRRTNDDEWAAMAEKGASRLVQGVVDRRFKVERAVTTLQAKMASHLQRIDSLPNVTDADRERRMVENLKGMRAIKGTV